MSALDAEAVPSEVVMTARRTHEPARRIRLQPSLVLAPVPDPVLGSEHPSPSFAVQNGQVANRDSKSAWRQVAHAALLDEEFESDLCLGEGIDGH